MLLNLEISSRIDECLSFMEACGINGNSVRQLNETDFFTSHGTTSSMKKH